MVNSAAMRREFSQRLAFARRGSRSQRAVMTSAFAARMLSAHTDGWASLRAGQGLLLSSTARAGSYGSAQGGQLDVHEAVAQLKGAQQLGQTLGQAAQGQGALGLTSHEAKAQEAVQALLDAIDLEKDGKHPSEQQGANRDARDPVAQFAKPYIVFDTPSAALTVSPASIASYSGQDTTLTAQGDIHAAAAHTASLISGETTSLYTHEGELQAIAANGKLSLRAHTDALELLADQDITVVSVNDEITLTAKERIEIVGGDSKVVLDGANIDFVTPGGFAVKAASHAWAGGGSGSAVVPALPTGGTTFEKHTLLLDHRYHDNAGVAGATYEVTFANGEKRTGELDGQGRAVISDAPTPTATVVYGPARASYARKGEAANPDLKPKPSTGQLESLVDKYAAKLTNTEGGSQS
jgi:type VI secretion system secreted protein VgrG